VEHFEFAVVGLGALGSATAYELARRGAQVVAFEQFELGHVRGASHDTSRIIRRTYDRPEYVKLADAAYQDWNRLEQATGERLVTETGGLTFCPPSAPLPIADYVGALGALDMDFEVLSSADVSRRWGQFHVPDDVFAVFTRDAGIVHANRSVAALQMHARMLGATLRDRCAVHRISPEEHGVVLHTASGPVSAGTVILCADAWTNKLLEPLGEEIPLRTMQEQVTYFKPTRPSAFEIGSFPLWIWEDEVCFYGFPSYGESTIKAARDVSDIGMSVDERSFIPSAPHLEELSRFMAATIPDSGEPLRTLTCQYALTPDRDFVIGPLPGHPAILVGLGAGHAFKFAPTIGRVLADLAVTGESDEDLSLFAPDRFARNQTASFATPSRV
jgi:sarcosine oxidase